MTSSVDFLRNQILSNSNDEIKVEVNQRHLIDKILARYSAKFVVFRELMQNSDDAKSSNVQIMYETARPDTDKRLKDKIKRIVFKNDGFAFRTDDWNRLKKIAEGNPDEQKIGAFGVGFYSLFSVCEEPCVLSGRQGITFYWRGNQLVTKQAQIDNEDQTWTKFVMDMREPEEFPDVEELSRFLANSLGFTGNLQNVSVYFNNTLVIRLSKDMERPEPVNYTTEFNTYSPQRMFHLTSVNFRHVQLDVKKLLIPSVEGWNSMPITDFNIEDATIFLRIASGNLDVNVTKAIVAEMERTTKKKPPSKTTIQMIYAGFDSMDHSDDVCPTFDDLIPYPHQGKIYIGFPTQQTTGCCTHLAARVIPTVERELVDLANKTLAKYNSEMLSLAGTMCRILYENEMIYISQLYNEMINENAANADEENTKSSRESFEKMAEHALTHFTFQQSTPNPEISRISESQFFSCSKKQLLMYSTNGILPISKVRIPNPEMAGFIKTVPIVPKNIFDSCTQFFSKAKDKKLIEDLSIKDVLSELQSRTLSEDEMVELLKWWISYREKGGIVSSSDQIQFMQLAHVETKTRSLNTIRHFLNPGIVPPHMDVPNEVLPYKISKTLKNNKDLEKWFNWTELSLADWANFIVNNPDLETDLTFARKVHNVLAKSLNSISNDDKDTIRRLFVQKKCIPTKLGMKYPNESYFQNVTLFPDLPNIDFPKPSSVKNLMELLDVRKVVDLRLIFERLVSNGEWDHIQLVKYLASKRSDLSEEEMKLLKSKSLWPREKSANSKVNGVNTRRFVAKDLYSPLGFHRGLGLHVIDWKGRWNRRTTEAQFLIELGLRDYPTLKKILELMAPWNYHADKAFKYFIENFKEKYAKDYKPDGIKVAFVPCRGVDVYAKPTECFINTECMRMKFKVVHQDLLYYAEQFGVRQNPSHDRLLRKLIDYPPRNEDSARKVFEYLATQQGDFTPSDWKVLADLEFIPTRNRKGAFVRARPRNCFFKKHYNDSLNNFFTYVNFGEKANRFLQSCGVKNEPSTTDVVELLLKSSRDLWNSTRDNADKYIDLLRIISIEYDVISKNNQDLVGEMMRKPILIALQKGKRGSNVRYNSLASAREIYVNDSPTYQKVFDPLIAPEEDLIETLYKKLGCKSLNDSVKETATPKGSILRENDKTRILEKVIKERAGLFYHEISRDKIINDHEWHRKLKVREVNQIELSVTLENRVEPRSTTACILHSTQLGAWVLYVTSDLNIFHVAQCITKNIFKSSKLKDTTYFNAILTADLQTLEDMGYPVDRAIQSNSGNVVNRHSQCSVKKPVVVNPQMTQTLRNSLRDAIKTCHSNFGSTINSQASVATVNESQSSYCEVIPGHLLHCVGTRQDIELYDSKSINQAEILLPSHNDSLNRFITMLKNIASVFELPLQTIHIFYDDYTNSVAFNRDRALFFNLKYYIGYHDNECKYKPTCNAMTYWFMTFCHELAHNFVQSHSSDHEFYFSSFAENYMSRFLAVMKNYQIAL